MWTGLGDTLWSLLLMDLRPQCGLGFPKDLYDMKESKHVMSEAYFTIRTRANVLFNNSEQNGTIIHELTTIVEDYIDSGGFVNSRTSTCPFGNKRKGLVVQ
jgi:hypothetical protein